MITTEAPSRESLGNFLQKEKDELHFDGSINYEKKRNYFGVVLWQILPIAFLIGFWIFMSRRLSGGGGAGGGGIFNVGKSRAQLFEKGTPVKVTFKDVAGLAEAKQEVEEIVEFLKEPQKYTDLAAGIIATLQQLFKFDFIITQYYLKESGSWLRNMMPYLSLTSPSED